MRYVRGLASTGCLEETLLHRVVPAGSLPESSAMRRISSLHRMSSGGLEHHGGGGTGGSNSPSGPSTWHQDDHPELHHSLRSLSRAALEELLASLAMASSKKYVNLSRSDAARAAITAMVGPSSPPA